MSISIFIIFESRREEFFRKLLAQSFSEWNIQSGQGNIIISNKSLILSIYRYNWEEYKSLSEDYEIKRIERLIKIFINDPVAYSLNVRGVNFILDIVEAMSNSSKCFVDNDHGAVIDGKIAVEEIRKDIRWLLQGSMPLSR